MQKRHELTDQQWERIKPLLPPQKPPIGRPAKDHRLIINGILWILKAGAPLERSARAVRIAEGETLEEAIVDQATAGAHH
jgi:hypothetical protein